MSAEDQTKPITKTMLIIKSDEKALRGVEQFLRNREWQLRSTHHLKDAILFLVQSKPSFVLVAIDHPNRKVQKLPKVLAAAFPCCVMLFAEKSSTASFKALIDSGAEYKINPPITGPAVERAVNKYIRDLEQAAKQKNNTVIAGSEKSTYEFQVEIKSSRQREPALLHLQSQNGEPHEAQSGILADEAFLQQNSLAQTLLAQLGMEPAGDPTAAPILSGSLILPKTAKTAGSVAADGKAHPSRQNSLDEEEEKAAAQELYVPQGQPKPASGETPAPVLESKQGSNLIYAREVEEGSNRRREFSEIPASLKFLKTKPGGIFEEDSLFIRGVSKSLDESVIKSEGAAWQPLEQSTHLACLLIEAQHFSGYLVAALAQDKKMDKEFVELVRSRLAKFLRENGDPIEDESSLQLRVKKVNFEAWALEQAEFLKKSLHKGDEVAMAFFPFASLKSQVGESAIQSMVSVSLQEIECNVPLEFNLYLYLPTNRKYILYTPNKGQLYWEQKERLSKRGIERLHLKKEDVQNLSKFKAQNRLNSLIDLHHKDLTQGKKIKKKAA